jgi:hypothetical protein
VKWLRKFFGREERAQIPADMVPIIAALRMPARWQPPEPLTKSDQAELRAMLASPLMRKLDVIMYNAGQQQMRDAAFAPPADMVAQGKFAAGFVAGWQRFKSFSVITLTETGEAETSADTGARGLEQHIP